MLRSGQLRYVLPAGFLRRCLGVRHVTDLAIETGRGAGIARDPGGRGSGLNLLRGSTTYAMVRDSRWKRPPGSRANKPGDHIDYFGASQKLPPLETGVVTDRATEYLTVLRAPN